MEKYILYIVIILKLCRIVLCCAVLCCIFIWLYQVLAQRTYGARLAGLGWRVGPHSCGFVMQVSGFSQKIDPLLEEVFTVPMSFIIHTCYRSRGCTWVFSFIFSLSLSLSLSFSISMLVIRKKSMPQRVGTHFFGCIIVFSLGRTKRTRFP